MNREELTKTFMMTFGLHGLYNDSQRFKGKYFPTFEAGNFSFE